MSEFLIRFSCVIIGIVLGSIGSVFYLTHKYFKDINNLSKRLGQVPMNDIFTGLDGLNDKDISDMEDKINNMMKKNREKKKERRNFKRNR